MKNNNQCPLSPVPVIRLWKDCLFIFCFCCMSLQLKHPYMPDSFFVCLPCILLLLMVTCSATGLSTLWQSDSSRINIWQPTDVQINNKEIVLDIQSDPHTSVLSVTGTCWITGELRYSGCCCCSTPKLESWSKLHQVQKSETQMEAYKSRVKVYGFFCVCVCVCLL